jgi:hypothetical protein
MKPSPIKKPSVSLPLQTLPILTKTSILLPSLFMGVTLLIGPALEAAEISTVVAANPLWTDTGIMLAPSDLVVVHNAQGSWTWGSCCNGLGGYFFGPEGDPQPTLAWDEWIPDGLHGQLIGFLGDDPYLSSPGDPGLFAVGTGTATLTGQSGRLWLGFNDDRVSHATSDNAGSVTVEISTPCLTLAPAVPQSAPVSTCFSSGAWPQWSAGNSVFLAATLNSAGAQIFVVLTNCGSVPVTLTDLGLAGADSNEFQVFPPLTHVAIFDTLKPGEQRTYSVTFSPLLPDSPGCKSAVLDVSAIGFAEPLELNLDGLAVLAPSSIIVEAGLAQNTVQSMALPGGPSNDLLSSLNQIGNTISRISSLLGQNNNSQAQNSKTAALGQAQAFLNKVAALTAAGVLSPAQGTQLANEGQILLEFIQMLTF